MALLSPYSADQPTDTLRIVHVDIPRYVERSKHVFYLVQCGVVAPGGRTLRFEVWRRFNDFVSLHTSTYLMLGLPSPFPVKKRLFHGDAIRQERALQLQAYLCVSAAAAGKVAEATPLLHQFLGVDARSLASSPPPPTVATPTPVDTPATLPRTADEASPPSTAGTAEQPTPLSAVQRAAREARGLPADGTDAGDASPPSERLPPMAAAPSAQAWGARWAAAVERAAAPAVAAACFAPLGAAASDVATQRAFVRSLGRHADAAALREMLAEGGVLDALAAALAALVAAEAEGRSALSAAAEEGIDVTDDDGCTALQRACLSGHAAAARLLLRGGAAVEVVRFVEPCGPPPLVIAAQRGDEPTAALLLGAGARVDSLDSEGHTPLLRAAAGGHAQLAATLIAAGASVERATPAMVTPLMLACANAAEGLARSLLDAQADVNAAASNGTTPLMAAAQGSSCELVTLLLDRRADLHATSTKGWDAMMWACSAGAEAVARLLLRSGAATHVVGADGATALSLAQRSGQPALCRLLDSEGIYLGA